MREFALAFDILSRFCLEMTIRATFEYNLNGDSLLFTCADTDGLPAHAHFLALPYLFPILAAPTWQRRVRVCAPRSVKLPSPSDLDALGGRIGIAQAPLGC